MAKKTYSVASISSKKRGKFTAVFIVLTVYCFSFSLALTTDFFDKSVKSSQIVIKSEYELNRKLNINTASYDELILLHSIGDVLATRIIDFRSNVHSFESIDEIRLVYGIDEVIFSKIKDEICVADYNVLDKKQNMATSVKFPVDLNTCSLYELSQIPEVSKDVAEKLIDLRTKIGKFDRIEEVLMVDSIGKKLYNTIINYAYVKRQ